MSRNTNDTRVGNTDEVPTSTPPQPGAPANKMVLIVEDEMPIAEALGFIIEDMGYAVCIAPHGRVALAMMRQQHPDLVFTDLMMPIMNGVDLIRALRASGETTLPIILMTAVTVAADDMLYKGASAVMNKPFDIETIEALVHRFLDD